MEIDPCDNSNWLADYGVVDVSAVDFLPSSGFTWSSRSVDVSSSNAGIEVNRASTKDSKNLKGMSCCKRLKSESCLPSGSKACREKLRRDRLNERFLELGSILEPGRPPKMDKSAILSDAVRMVTQLRTEAQKLKESNEELQEKIKELKAEKNELRDEKQRLKADKEKLEQQLKAMSFHPVFPPHLSALSTPFAGQERAGGDKLMPYVGFPGMAMWQFMPPSVLDTSRDHVLRPPVA
ncbi:transcription factor ILR3-like [Rhodamnia argentea]|uniref:Transcription factor ILR3-like n=1 Tax=Rhodamnia argentea TaxID=178133 RepID=A0A8B8QAX8_9MYRT|nr:transcription factor ILR3-like [Rhodamnia argentea]